MADQMEELIREIAAKHGIAVSRDDPILILQTINSRLLQESAKAQQEQLDRYKEELEALSLRWSTDAKNKAERILNTSLSANGTPASGPCWSGSWRPRRAAPARPTGSGSRSAPRT